MSSLPCFCVKVEPDSRLHELMLRYFTTEYRMRMGMISYIGDNKKRTLRHLHLLKWRIFSIIRKKYPLQPHIYIAPVGNLDPIARMRGYQQKYAIYFHVGGENEFRYIENLG